MTLYTITFNGTININLEGPAVPVVPPQSPLITSVVLSPSSGVANSSIGTVVGALTFTMSDASVPAGTWALTNTAGGNFRVVGNQIQFASGSVAANSYTIGGTLTVSGASNSPYTWTAIVVVSAVAPTIQSVTLSPTTGTANSAIGTQVGTLTFVMSDGSTPAGTFALTNSASGKFKLVSNQIQFALSNVGAASYTIGGTLTVAGASNSPYSWTAGITVSAVVPSILSVALTPQSGLPNQTTNTVLGTLSFTMSDGSTPSGTFTMPTNGGGAFQLVSNTQVEYANNSVANGSYTVGGTLTVTGASNSPYSWSSPIAISSGAPALYVSTPPDAVAGTAVTLNGTYSGTAPTGINYKWGSGSYSAATGFVALNGYWSCQGTAPAASTVTATVQMQNSLSTTATTLRSVVFSAAPSGTNTLTSLTVTNNGGANLTNAPFEFGLPMAAGTYPSGGSIKVLDQGGAALTIQEDNYAAGKRFLKVTGIMPAINAGETRTLTVQTVTGTGPGSGTDITTADILATAYDCVATITDQTGTVYTASARTGLAAGAFSALSTAAKMGTWRSGGGICTEYVLLVPAVNGGSPHPQLRVAFHVAAYKASTGAVNGGNPITAIRTDAIMENASMQVATPVDNFYSIGITSGATSVSFPASTPAATLTIASNPAGSQPGQPSAITSSAGIFTVNSIGQSITDGTGTAVISGYTNSTTVEAIIGIPFASGTVASGTWTLNGVNQPWGARWRQRLWWSGGQNVNIASALGVAWNGGTLTGGPSSYIIGTQMIPNYQAAASGITNVTTNFTAQGTNPTGFQSSSGGFSGGLAADVVQYFPTTGGRPDLAPIPGYQVGALIRWDANALTVLNGDAEKSFLMPFHWRSNNSGLTQDITLNSGTNHNDWYYDPYGGSHWTGTRIPNPYYNCVSCWNLQSAHHPNYFYLPYLLTGDLIYIESHGMLAFWVWSDLDPGYAGVGINKMCWGDESRGSAWALRTYAQYAAVCPTSTSVLGLSQSQMQSLVQSHWTATNSGTPQSPPFPGSNIGYIAATNTGAGQIYALSGPHWVGQRQGAGNVIESWMQNYFGGVMFHMRELGVWTPDAANLLSWYSDGLTTVASDTGVNKAYGWVNYFLLVVAPDKGTGGSANLSTWTSVWQNSANYYDPGGGHNGERTITGAASVSPLSGASVQITLPAGQVTDGSFYVGGLVMDGSYASVTSVPVPSGGTGYSNGQTIHLAMSATPASSAVTRQPVVTVTSTGAGGSVTGVSLTDPGLFTFGSIPQLPYQAGTYNNQNNTWTTNGYGNGYTASQASTNGGGTGVTFSGINVQPGLGVISAVSGNVVTVDTTAAHTPPHDTNVLFPGPFANATMQSDGYFLPASGPNDPLGLDMQAYIAIGPQSDQTYDWLCLYNLQLLAADDYLNSATAKSAFKAIWVNTAAGPDIPFNIQPRR